MMMKSCALTIRDIICSITEEVTDEHIEEKDGERMATHKPTNKQIADMLDEIADLLRDRGANPYRVRAYRDGAQSVRATDQSVADLVESQGTDALEELPQIGEGLAAAIGEYVSSGQSSLRTQLQAERSPAAVFARVPGVGEELAERIVNELNISTLPELERAAHDGRLDSVEGFGEKRVQSVRDGLAGMLSQSARRSSRQRRSGSNGSGGEDADDRPSVATLLDVDAEYRRKAEAGELKKIAPRRFNPNNEAWLPLLNTDRDDWTFTVLFSNTARAHEQNKTDDWVVIYYRKRDQGEDAEEQNTVVTETRGPLEGKRVVRGRSAENHEYYQV